MGNSCVSLVLLLLWVDGFLFSSARTFVLVNVDLWFPFVVILNVSTLKSVDAVKCFKERKKRSRHTLELVLC